MIRSSRFPSAETVGQLLSACAVFFASVAVTSLLFPDPLADAFYTGIVLLSIVFTVAGAIGTLTNRTPVVWVAALLMSGLSILGMMSIGFVLLPATLSLLGAAVFAQIAGPRTDVREAIIADPPSRREIIQKSILGIASVSIGLGLVYAGAFVHELFGACASETVSCALEKTNWSAVGLTLLGFAAVSVGGWLLWKQSYVTRVLASARTD